MEVTGVDGAITGAMTPAPAAVTVVEVASNGIQKPRVDKARLN